ncbi:hypothetical protein D3C73_1351530 [compost metagenome]
MHRLLLAQRQAQILLDRQVITRGRHVDLARGDDLFVLSLAYRPVQAPLQHFGQMAVTVIGQVQHAQHRRHECRRQAAEHLKQRLHAARRGTDHHRVYALHDFRKIRSGLTSGSKRSL